MVKIRLKRTGRVHAPSYRIVVSDARKIPTSNALADLGHYDPLERKGYELVIDEQATIDWLNKGAVPSDSVMSILKKHGVYAKFLEQKKANKAK